MHLDRLAGRDAHLRGLLHAARHWQQLDALFKSLLPANVAAHCHAVCVREGSLVVYADSAMAAARLKMLACSLLAGLQQADAGISGLSIKARPQPAAAAPEKDFHISEQALDCFERTAGELAHHPELAAAMRALAERHRR